MMTFFSSSDAASFNSVVICCRKVAILIIFSRVVAVLAVARTSQPYSGAVSCPSTSCSLTVCHFAGSVSADASTVPVASFADYRGFCRKGNAHDFMIHEF
jgi:hypothetical protein